MVYGLLKLVDAKAGEIPRIYQPMRDILPTSRQPMRMQRAVPSERSVSILFTGLFIEARWLNSRIESI